MSRTIRGGAVSSSPNQNLTSPFLSIIMPSFGSLTRVRGHSIIPPKVSTPLLLLTDIIERHKDCGCIHRRFCSALASGPLAHVCMTGHRPFISEIYYLLFHLKIWQPKLQCRVPVLSALYSITAHSDAHDAGN